MAKHHEWAREVELYRSSRSHWSVESRCHLPVDGKMAELQPFLYVAPFSVGELRAHKLHEPHRSIAFILSAEDAVGFPTAAITLIAATFAYLFHCF